MPQILLRKKKKKTKKKFCPAKETVNKMKGSL